MPEIDLVIMVGSGGLKVRYIDVVNPSPLAVAATGQAVGQSPQQPRVKENKESLVRSLAQLYVENHELM